MITREAAVELRRMVESRRASNLDTIAQMEQRVETNRKLLEGSEAALEGLQRIERAYIELLDLCAQSLGETVSDDQER